MTAEEIKEKIDKAHREVYEDIKNNKRIYSIVINDKKKESIDIELFVKDNSFMWIAKSYLNLKCYPPYLFLLKEEIWQTIEEELNIDINKILEYITKQEKWEESKNRIEKLENRVVKNTENCVAALKINSPIFYQEYVRRNKDGFMVDSQRLAREYKRSFYGNVGWSGAVLFQSIVLFLETVVIKEIIQRLI